MVTRKGNVYLRPIGIFVGDVRIASERGFGILAPKFGTYQIDLIGGGVTQTSRLLQSTRVVVTRLRSFDLASTGGPSAPKGTLCNGYKMEFDLVRRAQAIL